MNKMTTEEMQLEIKVLKQRLADYDSAEAQHHNNIVALSEEHGQLKQDVKGLAVKLDLLKGSSRMLYVDQAG